MPEDVDKAEDCCDAPEEAKPGALGFSRGIGVVAEVGVLYLAS